MRGPALRRPRARSGGVLANTWRVSRSSVAGVGRGISESVPRAFGEYEM